jgi:hypothetical protein
MAWHCTTFKTELHSNTNKFKQKSVVALHTQGTFHKNESYKECLTENPRKRALHWRTKIRLNH